MALPSQTERQSETARSVSGPTSGSGNSTRIALVVAGLVLLGGGVWALSNIAKKQGETAKTQPSKVADVAGSTIPLPDAPITLATGTPTPGATTPGAVPFGTQPTTSQPTTVLRDGASTTQPSGSVTGTPTTANPTPVGVQPSTPATTQPTTVLTPAPTSVTTNTTVLQFIEAGDKAVANNKLVEARAAYSKALLDRDASDADKATLRTKMTTINQDLVFGTRVEPTDSLVESYKVQPGDSMVRIVKRRELATDWRLIQRVNRIANPNSLRAGQTIKLVKGPFHAVVNKAAYRVDIFAGAPDDPAAWLFVKSYTVGLGEGNSTPVGNYVIKKGSKLVDPPWTNPRTGEKFASNDAKNPIGEHWIGWQGVGDSKVNQGYGFHGTIEADSIGKQMSMGCARMKAEDVAELFELLVEEISVVRVLP